MTSRGFSAGRRVTLRYSDGLDPDELGLEVRLAILKEHRNHLLKIRLELVERISLRVGTRKARHVSDQETSVRVPLHHRSEVPHRSS
jgi:hypothetical protein